MRKIRAASLIATFHALILMGIVTGCEKDVYNPDNKGKLPPMEDYFDFNLVGDILLDVDYASEDLKVLFEVYTENPLNEGGYSKKVDAKPIYAAYTNKDGKFAGKISLPTALKEVYLYTAYYGFPKCVKAEVTSAGINYNIAATTTTRAGEAGYNWSSVTKYPCAMNTFDRFREDNLYALYKWGVFGVIEKDIQIYKTPSVETTNETMDNFTTRIQRFITNLSVKERREQLIGTREKTDVKVKEDGTTFDVVFMGDAAQYANVFGYYYYTEKEYKNWDFSLKRKKKYIVLPNASYRDSRDGKGTDVLVLEKGTTVKLQYFGPNGDSAPTYEFPKDCIVGWFYGRNNFVRPGGSTGSIPENGIWEMTAAYSSIDSDGTDTKKQRFIALKDATTNVLVLGFEDSEKIAQDPDKADLGQEDYMDVLFYVKSNKDITDGKPEIPADPKPEPEGEFTLTGTVAFEDIWPNGGDYDLNDVIVEYKREITFNSDNKATKTVETFTPVQPAASALQDNFFACQYLNLGTMNVAAGVIKEANTNSFVIEQSVRSIPTGTSYVIERILDGTKSQKEITDDFNPYIITKKYSAAGRIEVHLPKGKMTSAADETLMDEHNAYYIDESGKYPFAIMIPILKFAPATERTRIDAEGEYPSFKTWTESKGEKNKDWYNNYQGKK